MLGAVLHWIYFTPFRRNAAVWAQAIIWISIAGVVMSIVGLGGMLLSATTLLPAWRRVRRRVRAMGRAA